MGKTRILFEIFKKVENNQESILLSNRILYLDYNYLTSEIDFSYFMSQVNQNKSDAILVIDNCNIDKHKIIAKHLTEGLTLITIDSNPEEYSLNKIRNTQYFVIEKNFFSDITECIISSMFKGLDKNKIEQIKEFSDGIPFMAILLGRSIKNGELRRESKC